MIKFHSMILFRFYPIQLIISLPVSPSVPLVQQDTLLIWGRNDEILEPSTAFKFVEQLPKCKELKWIENCGHVPHLEQPAETASAILTFLGDVQ
jgi:pimeloyl-ACP methyl ester carboxylesterase